MGRLEGRVALVTGTGSTSALGNRGQANYSAAKAGLQGFTKTLALELGHFGVTVNAVAPGFIETEMTRTTAARMGVAWEDSAAAILYFASEEASFVSGQVLYVAGGPRD